MTPIELISIIEQRGGFVALTLNGDKLRVRLPRDEAEHFKTALQAIKPAIVALLRQRTVVHLDVTCTCGEQSYPHFRHRGGMRMEIREGCDDHSPPLSGKMRCG